MEHYYKNLEGWFDFFNFYRAVIHQIDWEGLIVEVGSWQGKSAVFMAVEILNQNKNIKINCVDTWEGSIEHKEENIIQKNLLYETFLKNIEPVKQVIKPIRKSSVEGAKLFKDNSVDLVFIDAAHDYENVKNDINAWYPKVKPGGILAGHDKTWPGVVKAVNEFLLESNNALHILDRDVWGLFKPGKLLRVPTDEEAAPAIKALGKL